MNLVTITASGVLALGLPFAAPWLLQEPAQPSTSAAPSTIDLSGLRGLFAGTAPVQASGQQAPLPPLAPVAPLAPNVALPASTTVAPLAPSAPWPASTGLLAPAIDTRPLAPQAPSGVLAPRAPSVAQDDDATLAQLAELQARIAALQAEVAALSAGLPAAGGRGVDTWPGALPAIDESEMEVEWIYETQPAPGPETDVDPWPMLERALRRMRTAEEQERAFGAAGAAAEQHRAEAERAMAEALAAYEAHGDELRARGLELRELAQRQAQVEREAARMRSEGRRAELLAELAQLEARMQASTGAVEDLYALVDVESSERIQDQLEARIDELEARMETLDWQIEARSDELALLDEQQFEFEYDFDFEHDFDFEGDWESDASGARPTDSQRASELQSLFESIRAAQLGDIGYRGGNQFGRGADSATYEEPVAAAGQPLWLDLRQPAPDARPAVTTSPNNGTVIVNVGAAGSDADVIQLLREIRDEVRGLRADLRNLHGAPLPAAPRGSRPDVGFAPNSSFGGGFGHGADPFGQSGTFAPQTEGLPARANVYGDDASAASGGGSNQLSSVEFLAPRVIRQQAPTIDAALRAAGPATVNVNLLVSEAGAVANAAVRSSTDARFDQAALDAVTQWVFEPGRVDGEPSAMFVDVPIVFPSTGK